MIRAWARMGPGVAMPLLASCTLSCTVPEAAVASASLALTVAPATSVQGENTLIELSIGEPVCACILHTIYSSLSLSLCV